MNSAAISIDSVSKVFRGKKLQRVVALDGLSLELAAGQVFGFLGPNGAGKSTTIKILTGQIRPTRGSAAIFGTPVSFHAARHRLGYLPENPSFYEFLSAREYLQLVGKVFSMPAASLQKRMESVLERLALTDAARRPIRSYSKGMVQRLGLAQALLHDPDLYILDEPMSGLDPIGRALVKEIILDLKRRGKTVFFSTHITNDVEMVCDNFAILNKGVLQVSSSVAEVVHAEGGDPYTVWSKTAHGEEVFRHCGTAELPAVLQGLIDEGLAVEKVVQKRCSLEDYFLDVVRRASS